MNGMSEKVPTYFLIFVNGNDPNELKETGNIRKLFPNWKSESFVKDVLQILKKDLLPTEKKLEDFVRDLIDGLSFGLYYCPTQTIVIKRMKDEIVNGKLMEIETKGMEIEAIAALKKAKDDEKRAIEANRRDTSEELYH